MVKNTNTEGVGLKRKCLSYTKKQMWSYLQDNFERMRKTEEVLVMQGHPGQWDDSRLVEFRKIVKYLKAQNATFMMPSEYVNFKVQ